MTEIATIFHKMWRFNGHMLSQQYIGSRALKVSLTIILLKIIIVAVVLVVKLFLLVVLLFVLFTVSRFLFAVCCAICCYLSFSATHFVFLTSTHFFFYFYQGNASTSRRRVVGMLKDSSTSFLRFYRSNFADVYRQDAIDMLLVCLLFEKN